MLKDLDNVRTLHAASLRRRLLPLARLHCRLGSYYAARRLNGTYVTYHKPHWIRVCKRLPGKPPAPQLAPHLTAVPRACRAPLIRVPNLRYLLFIVPACIAFQREPGVHDTRNPLCPTASCSVSMLCRSKSRKASMRLMWSG